MSSNQTKTENQKRREVNFFIIIEMLYLMKSKQISMGQIIYYLFTQDSTFKDKDLLNKLKNRKDTFFYNNTGDFSSAYETLKQYGISKLLFCEPETIPEYKIPSNYWLLEKIGVSDSLWNDVQEYLELNDAQKDLGELRSELLKEMYNITNLDGTLMIESLQDILMDMNIFEKGQERDIDILESIANTRVADGSTYSQNELIKIYKKIGKQAAEQGNLPNVDFDAPKGNFSKIPKSAHSDIICENLCVIFNTYCVFVDIDNLDMEKAAENLRQYLGLSDSEFETLVNGASIEIKSREIAQKLSVHKFPASLFRADSTTRINLTAELANAVDEFSQDKNVALFRFRLRYGLTHNINIKNLVLVLGVYSLYNSLNPNIQK